MHWICVHFVDQSGTMWSLSGLMKILALVEEINKGLLRALVFKWILSRYERLLFGR